MKKEGRGKERRGWKILEDGENERWRREKKQTPKKWEREKEWNNKQG
jgi:hypothetical protein